MPTFDVFQQRHPIKSAREAMNISGTEPTPWEVNLVKVGTVEAYSGSHAIDLAQQLPAFRIASRRTLSAFPVEARAWN